MSRFYGLEEPAEPPEVPTGLGSYHVMTFREDSTNITFPESNLEKYIFVQPTRGTTVRLLSHVFDGKVVAPPTIRYQITYSTISLSHVRKKDLFDVDLSETRHNTEMFILGKSFRFSDITPDWGMVSRFTLAFKVVGGSSNGYRNSIHISIDAE